MQGVKLKNVKDIKYRVWSGVLDLGVLKGPEFGV